MIAEFVDTNVLVYAHDRSAASKQVAALSLLNWLNDTGAGVISTQVLIEFYNTATRKAHRSSEEAEAILSDLETWHIHRPTHQDLLDAARLHRLIKYSWWDSLIIQSATAMGCEVLWSEDLSHLQQIGDLVVRNPFQPQ